MLKKKQRQDINVVVIEKKRYSLLLKVSRSPCLVFESLYMYMILEKKTITEKKCTE